MSDTPWTPGPWPTPEEAGDPYDSRIPVDHEGCEVWPWKREEDMRLAYAAPEMAELLIELRTATKGLHFNDGPEPEGGCLGCRADALLARIKGES